MTSGPMRYPGAQPFSDEAISRAVFFGRAKESAALADQILANRLLVVYAKSGLGKTSLLQAGVAQPLRDEGHLPLFVRVNDVKQAPMRRILDGVQDSAVRQKVEYHPGSELSLWHFFKTAEFWLADRLLTPVLVLDQFEELFTIHGTEARAAFLREFGHLVRGARPELELERTSVPRGEAPLTDTPPRVRTVISLREDYLGSLEEAADNIPQILDHRFRLKPLTVQAAVDALEGPATVTDERLATQPFTYGQDTVQAILAHLSQRTRGSAVLRGNYVEPFHLQLICQRTEELVAERQRQGAQQVEIVLEDLGGEPGLKATLRDFYKNVIGGIELTSTRKRVRRLCEHYLISPEGRRLSLERGEIKRIVKLGADTLGDLVDRRLLRSDQRADSWYYELSHDSLVAPILATRKARGLAFGVLGLLASLLGFVFAISLLVLSVVMFGLAFVYWSPEGGARTGDDRFGVLVGSLLFLPTGPLFFWICITAVRRSVEALNRYTSPPSS
jgi:hypothetical protein